MADRFFIGPFNSGLVKDKKPFLLPEDAFESLRNAYVFRDRVRKRFGARVMNWTVDSNVQQLYTRFRVKLNNEYGNPASTNGAGDFTGTVPLDAGTPIVTPAIGQLFSVEGQIFTVTALGNPANLLSTGAATATFDTTTGAIIITGAAANADVYFYPALPVMGLLSRETASVNDEELIGFDTRFSYTFNGVGWERLDAAYSWTGTDSQFFWGANYRGALPSDLTFFVTNFNTADEMAYFNGTTWTNFSPIYNSSTGDVVRTAKIIVPFQNRLVLLNTVEQVGGGNQSFRNRARFCQFGNPLQLEAFYEPPTNFGRGDHIDAPTSEAIQTALILKDRLIVFFERSTWELVYTGNQVVPFVWQTINIELGAESTFSIVPFDKVLLGIGDVGIHACNGANVDRIDEKIPDEVFNIQNVNQGPDRVYGVRDYSAEMTYWAFPYDSSDIGITYPNRVFVYNYRNGAWAFNDDSITAFGQYQLDTSVTWRATDIAWEDADFSWDAGTNIALARNVVAGNQQGFVFILDSATRQTSTNAHAISITDITETNLLGTVTAVNHNLSNGDYILIDYARSTNDPNSSIPLAVNDKIFSVRPVTADTFVIQISADTPFDAGALYAGGATFRRVSQIQIVTKQYNFYLDKGYSFAINKIDLLVDSVANGELTVSTYANSGNISVDNAMLITYPYSNIYAPMEQWQDMLWHTIYPSGFGTFLQFEITLNHDQMRDVLKADADFVLNSMVIYADPCSYRMQ